jgi:hypothetical protein
MACAAAHPRFLGDQDQPGMYVRFNPRSDVIFVIGAEVDRIAVIEAPTYWEGGILEYVETQGCAERVLGWLERIYRFSDEDLSDEDKQQKLKDFLLVLVEGSEEGKRLFGHDIIGFDVPGLDLRRLHAMLVAKIHQALGMTARKTETLQSALILQYLFQGSDIQLFHPLQETVGIVRCARSRMWLR